MKCDLNYRKSDAEENNEAETESHFSEHWLSPVCTPRSDRTHG